MEKTIQLIRTNRQANAIYGHIDVPYDRDTIRCATIENADYIIPAGKYQLRSTWSNRFQKFMPEICDVPERTGIRIHMGSVPEHSTGCVLVSAYGLSTINSLINQSDKYEQELFIEIRDISEQA